MYLQRCSKVYKSRHSKKRFLQEKRFNRASISILGFLLLLLVRAPLLTRVDFEKIDRLLHFHIKIVL